MALSRLNPYVLISVGLLWITALQLILRLVHPAFLAQDLAQGVWFGIGIGLEILGLLRLRQMRSGRPR